MKGVYEELEERVTGKRLDEALAVIKPDRVFAVRDGVIAVVLDEEYIWTYHLMVRKNVVRDAQVLGIPCRVMLSWLLGKPEPETRAMLKTQAKKQAR